MRFQLTWVRFLRWCFVMEYVSRGTLSQIIRRSGHLSESKAKLVSAQLAHALNFVHGAGKRYVFTVPVLHFFDLHNLHSQL